MRLRALTGLEREKLEAELKELLAKIAEYKAILSDKKSSLPSSRQKSVPLRINMPMKEEHRLDLTNTIYPWKI